MELDSGFQRPAFFFLTRKKTTGWGTKSLKVMPNFKFNLLSKVERN